MLSVFCSEKLLHCRIVALASWSAVLCKTCASKCVQKAYSVCLEQGFQRQTRRDTPEKWQQ